MHLTLVIQYKDYKHHISIEYKNLSTLGIVIKITSYRNEHTLGAQSKWCPGTDKLVMNIVAHLNKKTEPDNAANLRSMIDLQERKLILNIKVTCNICLHNSFSF